MLFILIIGIIGIIARKEPMTRDNLRDLAHQHQVAKFNTDIDAIIDEVVRCASANLTKYTIVLRFLPFETTSHISLNTIFAFAPDSVIIANIREVLVDSHITIVPTYCNSYEELRYSSRLMCKEMIIEW
jgi:hypothetical protein